jgi:hypothetical protein
MGTSQSKNTVHFEFEDQLARIDSGQEYSTIEVEVKVPIRCIGRVNYKHFEIRPWDFSEIPAGESRSIYFKGVSLHWGPEHRIDGAKDGFYHGGSAMQEIAQLYTVFFRIPFEVGDTIRMNDQPFRDRNSNQRVRTVHKDKIRLGEGLPFLDKAKNLKPNLKQPYMLACKFYLQGLRQFSDEPDLSFISFITALESLAQTQSVEECGFDPELEALLGGITDKNLHLKLRKRLWSTMSATHKFVRLCSSHLTDNFWNDDSRPTVDWQRVTKNEMEEILKKYYSCRSKFLHEGQPLPPTLYGVLGGSEKCASTGRQISRKSWDGKDLVPPISFLELLTHHVLLEFMERNQIAGENSEVNTE